VRNHGLSGLHPAQYSIEEGKLRKGDLLLIAAVGAGFTSGATLMRWAI
jgi:3-oxoacyl-[acyl-carrier-protein] synthase III